MNTCCKCHIRFDPHQDRTWLVCRACKKEQQENWTKEAIEIWGTIQNQAPDNESKANAGRVRINYIRELQEQ